MICEALKAKKTLNVYESLRVLSDLFIIL